jgi:hypothetical protein
VEKLFAVDWAELVIPTHSIGEMLVRGTATYLALFLILRFVMKRQTSTIGIADILVVVVIADGAQNAFSREYRSITEGLVLVLTIVFILGFRAQLFELPLQALRASARADADAPHQRWGHDQAQYAQGIHYRG